MYYAQLSSMSMWDQALPRRKLFEQKSEWHLETIRVDAVKKAAKFLQNSDMYLAENIQVGFDDFENINEAEG